MTEPPPPNRGLARRLDLFAAANPTGLLRFMWWFGLLAAWTSVGTASAVAAGRWVVSVMLLGTAAFSGFLFWAMLRARRRVPQTKRRLDDESR